MTLADLWFCLVAVMVTMYVVLDGFDLGVGAVHLFVARNDAERRAVLRSIGPVWDGNQVWLLAAGGTLYFAFPRLYAVAFSGFYLPLIIVLWLLMLRAIALELRGHIDSDLWRQGWDVIFAGSSALLVLFLGVALGNVVRGVPIGESGYFFSPLWTDFRLGEERGIIDWYTLLVWLAAVAALTTHGSLWLVKKSVGAVHARAARIAARGWYATVAAALAVTAVSFWVQPKIAASFQQRPWGVIFPLLAIVGLVGIRRYSRRGAELAAFAASCLFILGMMTSTVFGLYPWVLPAGPDASMSLTVADTATSPYGMRVGLMWFIPGMLLVTCYFVYTYRSFAGKVDTGKDAGY